MSEDIIESLMEHHRSGRSLDELDKTIEDFWFASDFDVSKPGEHDNYTYIGMVEVEITAKFVSNL